MLEDGITIFERWVKRHGATTDRTRSLLTLAAFISDDERLLQLRLEAPGNWLDETLADELLTVAEPNEVVTALADGIGSCLSPGLFQKYFDWTLAHTTDIDLLSRLMFAAAMYLRHRRPGAFQLPYSLARRLLASQDLDHRLGGLKSLVHSEASVNEIYTELAKALQTDDFQERWTGIGSLLWLLESEPTRRAAELDPKVLTELQRVLSEAANRAPDDNERVALGRCEALIKNWEEK